MPTNVTLITPDGERFSEPVKDGRVSLPWLHPYERMNGQWQILETGYTFEIKLPFNEDEGQILETEKNKREWQDI